ncbi:MAG TPA: hypothetical protein VGC32_14515 [Solirubrobacterales bacterium]
MKIGTPFGEFPFVYKRIERREDSVAIVGTVAGVDSRVVFDADDGKRAAIVAGVPLAVATLVLAARRR